MQTAADDIQSVIKARKYVTTVGMATRAGRHVTAVNATHIVTHEQKSVRHNKDNHKLSATHERENVIDMSRVMRNPVFGPTQTGGCTVTVDG